MYVVVHPLVASVLAYMVFVYGLVARIYIYNIVWYLLTADNFVI